MDQTFETKFGNYSLLLSLNERTIYFKIIDSINFTMYEGNTDSKEIRLNFNLEDTYQIITKCFKGETGYSVKTSINSGVCKLAFGAIVGGFLKVNFEVMLREKIMSNDSQLTLNFNKLEQKLNAGLANLQTRIDELESSIKTKNSQIDDLTNKLSVGHICLCSNTNGNPITSHFVPLNSTSLQIDTPGSYNLSLLSYLYKLTSLTINNYTIPHIQFSSPSLTYLSLNLQAPQGQGLVSIGGITQLPNLQNLVIMNGQRLRDIPSAISSYQHKIKSITIQTCPQVNVVELQTYCQKNNIALNIS